MLRLGPCLCPSMGGVLEHPAWSDAFGAFGIAPPKPGGWQRTICGGWTCYVEQGRYGHPAKKATWLYAHGIAEPPAIDCRDLRPRDSRSQVSWCGNHTSKFDKRPRVGKRVAAATPVAFRDLLISIARSAMTEPGNKREVG